jgi:cbb3-type cytochrome oxidase maturation protein
MTWYIVSSLAMGFGGLIFYFYFFNKGQFVNHEDVKYQILRDEEDA